MSEKTEETVSVQVMDDLLEQMFKLKAEIVAKDRESSEMNKKLAVLKAQAVEKLKALERKSYTSAHGTIGIARSFRFNLPQDIEDKKKVFKYFKEVGGEGLLYDMATVNSNKFSAYCNTEWNEAKKKGLGLDYKSPWGGEPILFETVSMKSKAGGPESDDE